MNYKKSQFILELICFPKFGLLELISIELIEKLKLILTQSMIYKIHNSAFIIQNFMRHLQESNHV